MLKRGSFPIESIYMPVKRRTMLDKVRVNAIAESMLVSGQTTPIMVREDGARLVLIEGLHVLKRQRPSGRERSFNIVWMRGSIRMTQLERSGHA